MGGYNRCSLICLIVSAVFAYKSCQATGVNFCGSPQKLPCDNSECISRDTWCDGEIDCVDESDEQYCVKRGWFGSVPDNHCTEKHFTCANGPCIPAAARCDAFGDCSDLSDEEDCEETTTPASLGYSRTQSVETSQDNTSNSYDDNDYDAYDRPLSGSTSTTTASSITTTTSTTTVRSTTPRSSTSTVSSRFPPSRGFYDKRREEASVQPSVQRPYYPNRNNHYYPNYNGHNQNGRPYYAPNRPIVEQGPYRPSNNYNRGYDTPHATDNYYGQNSRGASYNGQRPHSSYPSGRGSDIAPRQFYPASELSSLQPVYPPRTTSAAPDQLTFRNGHDSSRTVRNSHVRRQRPNIIQPRIVLPPPTPRPPRKVQHSSLMAPFYFAKNYTEQISYRYLNKIENAKQWLISRRKSSYTWDDDTPRALVALSLITNSFTSDIAENEYMKKSLQTHLGITLLRSQTQRMPITRLAAYVNALLATCQNPRDFLNHDLVEELYRRRYGISDNESEVSPLVFLTLCLANRSLSWEDIRNLELLLNRRYPDDLTKDRHILATTALACILQQNHGNEIWRYLRQIEAGAVHYILSQKHNDGSFGSIYSTAIAAQALMSINYSIPWNPEPTLEYLAGHQLQNGSFGDMLSTYHILPVLSGRSLLHLRNTQCDQAVTKNETLSPEDLWNLPGERKNVFYSVAVGYPERISLAMEMNVPQSLSIIDIMVIANYLDPRFRFEYKTTDRGTEVFTIYGIPNDPERKLHWNLYLLGSPGSDVDLRRRSEEDIKRIIPQNGQEFLFWYLQSD